MHRCRRPIVLLALLLGGGASSWAQPIDETAERARIAAETGRVEREYAAQRAACYQKFAVNDCLAQARDARREVLGDLKRQENALNDAARKRSAAQQVQRLQERQSAADEADAAARRDRALADQQAREQRAANRASDRAQAEAAAPQRRQEQADRARSQEMRQAEAAQRASQAPVLQSRATERGREAEERRARRLEAARKKRESGKAPAQPLPVPP